MGNGGETADTEDAHSVGTEIMTEPLESRMADSRASARRGAFYSALEAIDDDFDGVSHLAVEFEVVGELNQRAIDSCAKKTLLEKVFREVAVFALLPLNEGGENEIACAVGEQGDSIDDLIEGLSLDLLLAFGAASLADSGVEDAEIVVDFGDGADGTAGVASAGFLLDGDRGGQPGDGILRPRVWAFARGIASRSWRDDASGAWPSA